MSLINQNYNVLYINLQNRLDRKHRVEQQLNDLGLKYERFNAIKHENPAIGCSMSHLKCLEMAKHNKWSNVMILEDDILFLKPSVFSEQLNKFHSCHTTWDVLLLAGNVVPPYDRIDETCIKVSRCQTTTGYVVKQHYYDRLINNIKESILKLMLNPEKQLQYAIDKHWFSLQKSDLWYLLIPLTVTQAPGYSDIEKKQVNYTPLMLDLDKKWLFPSNAQFR
jgi:GR25 family glycosyltransferase involved in LPS biosynthesis